jgi:protein-L-isoaspartate O-methyltransferase
MRGDALKKINVQAHADRSLHRLSDYIYDKKLGIYVSPSATTAVRMRGAVKSVKGLPLFFHGLTRRFTEWPSREHLRNNILEMVAELFDKGSSVLEIGPGRGASTRWLGERFRRVDAFAGDLRSALAARTAASGLGNVKIYLGDFSRTSFHGYDMITMIGALESLDCGPTPCAHLLKTLGRSLNERGILVLAVKNERGIKFSPHSESHGPAFGRNELEEILKESGFNNIHFYHLFPDYNLARTIIAESEEVLALRPYNWINMLAGGIKCSIPGPIFLKAMTEAGLLWQLSSSFLVLAARSESINLRAGWLVKKMNNESYDKKFHHSITLERNGPSTYVVKRAPLPGSMSSFEAQGVEYRLESKEYVSGELLSFSLYRALLEKDQEAAIENTIRIVYDSLISRYSTGKNDAGGYPLVSGEAIDYTLWNLVFLEDGELFFIDRKWTVKEDIPADLVLFRNLFHAYLMAYPFLKDKNRLSFITNNIKCIYPQYSPGRLKYDVRLEEKFQSAICGRKVTIGMDAIAGTALSKLSIVHQRLGSFLAERA